MIVAWSITLIAAMFRPSRIEAQSRKAYLSHMDFHLGRPVATFSFFSVVTACLDFSLP